LLLVSAGLLCAAVVHYTPYGSHFEHRSSNYGSHLFYERLRVVVCCSWILTAARFYDHRWRAVALLSVAVAWLFNPIFPVTMTRMAWQPYDSLTIVLSVTAALALAGLSYRRRLRT
jgi:hypothetical protein